jgi:hypothetical protein
MSIDKKIKEAIGQLPPEYQANATAFADKQATEIKTRRAAVIEKSK